MKDNKGTLLPGERALLYLRKQFVISAKLQGRIGKFYQVRTYKVKGTDQDYTYEEPVDVAYHLDTNPSRKLLTQYGWQVEDPTQSPILLYLTFHDMKDNPIRIDEGAKLEISGKQSIAKNDILTKEFIITEVRTDLELNQCVCKVSPVREEQKENVKVLATEKDPNLENVYLDRKIYFEKGDESNEDNKFISRK